MAIVIVVLVAGCVAAFQSNLIHSLIYLVCGAVIAYLGLAPMAAMSRQALIDAHQAERSAANGSLSKAVSNLLGMAMLTGEMNVPS